MLFSNAEVIDVLFDSILKEADFNILIFGGQNKIVYCEIPRCRGYWYNDFSSAMFSNYL